jgi:hypothetical protein
VHQILRCFEAVMVVLWPEFYKEAILSSEIQLLLDQITSLLPIAYIGPRYGVYMKARTSPFLTPFYVQHALHRPSFCCQ